MKKVFNLALITIFTLSALSVQAQVLSDTEIKANISRQVVESYKQYTDAQLVASVIALPFHNLSVPDGKISFVVTSPLNKFMARDLKKVVIYVNDKPARTFNVPVDVKAYQEVLVASGFIEREKMLSPSLVVTKKVEVSNNLEYILTSKMLEKEIITKKTFREGEVIDKRFVKLRPDVQRNSSVTAYFSSDNLMIGINATALEEGMLGDYINVENKTYKKIYTGKIIGENKVLIHI